MCWSFQCLFFQMQITSFVLFILKQNEISQGGKGLDEWFFSCLFMSCLFSQVCVVNSRYDSGFSYGYMNVS